MGYYFICTNYTIDTLNMITSDTLKRYWVKLAVLLIADGEKKAQWLKKHRIFHHIGENCSFKTNILPAEPFLVCLHDNVRIAAGCRLITHSMTCSVFNRATGSNRFYCQYGKIEIHSNVFVGGGKYDHVRCDHW